MSKKKRENKRVRASSGRQAGVLRGQMAGSRGVGASDWMPGIIGDHPPPCALPSTVAAHCARATLETGVGLPSPLAKSKS